MTRILFLGRLRDAAGAERDIELPANIATGADLIAFLGRTDDALRRALEHPAVKIVADGAVVPCAAPISAAGEIAFLPPFSGG